MKVGSRNGRLVVLGAVEGDKRRLRVRCDCGTEKMVWTGNWHKTQSCGCLMREVNSARNATHGLTRGSSRGARRPAEYETWANMVQRCTNPARVEWPRYGGRGIKVCERWLSVENFIADMGPRPSPRHSLDRIDVNGNYEAGNCRWATAKEQGANKRNNHYIEFRGARMTVSDAADAAGISRLLFSQRIGRGWSPEDAAAIAPKPRPMLKLEVGQRFGRLVVVESVGKAFKGNHICYRCKCDCGGEKIAAGSKLVAGAFRYCTQGCRLRKEVA